jgi:gamma-glutamylcyclotransferase (GGCT)/AIG2-like uncharacterized protein YtfP
VATEPPLHFFFYGTLLGGGPDEVRMAMARLTDRGPAQGVGRLHAIPDPQGWYPALLGGVGIVAGRVYLASAEFGDEDLATLDRYEGFDPRDPDRSLYRRIALSIGTDTGQAYRYNQPLPAGARPIPDGDFAAWIEREGLTPFAG